MQLLQQMINGITIGAFYVLVAMGYTMVYGVLKLINFAHGDLFMWGAYIGLTTLTGLLSFVAQGSAWLAIPAVIVVMLTVAIMGVLVERIAYRPLRNAGRLAPVISALGVAFILQSLARNIYGASYQTYPQDVVLSGGFSFGSARISTMQIVVLVVSFLLMAVLYLFVQRTRVGTAMRAVSPSRTSPTRIVSGSSLRMDRRPPAKVRPALGLTCIWLMFPKRYSTGSSMVIIFCDVLSIWLMEA